MLAEQSVQRPQSWDDLAQQNPDEPWRNVEDDTYVADEKAAAFALRGGRIHRGARAASFLQAGGSFQTDQEVMLRSWNAYMVGVLLDCCSPTLGALTVIPTAPYLRAEEGDFKRPWFTDKDAVKAISGAATAFASCPNYDETPSAVAACRLIERTIKQKRWTAQDVFVPTVDQVAAFLVHSQIQCRENYGSAQSFEKAGREMQKVIGAYYQKYAPLISAHLGAQPSKPSAGAPSTKPTTPAL